MAKPQTRGLGRGLDALLGSEVKPAATPVRSEEAKPAETPRERVAVEDVVTEAEATKPVSAPVVAPVAAQQHVAETPAPAPVVEEPVVKATEPVKQVSSEDPDISFRPARELSAESIDVHFSLSEPEITERAPRPKPAPAPASEPVAPAPAPQEQAAPLITDGSLAQIALEFIEVNPYQPRLKFDQEPLDELATSIARDGLLQPITVRPLADGRFQIISGERRFRASRMAGLRSIPAYVREATDKEIGKYALIENLQRENLNPIEAAIGYRNLMKAQHLTQSEVAQLVCKGRSTVANTLRLLDLPEDLQEMIYKGQLSEGHARAIQGLPTAEGRRKLAEKVVAEELSVRATENLVKFMTGRKTEADGEKTERAVVPAAYKAVARTLKQHLNATVKVKNSGGKNKIEIEFADAADLERIFSQIMGSQVEIPEE